MYRENNMVALIWTVCLWFRMLQIPIGCNWSAAINIVLSNYFLPRTPLSHLITLWWAVSICTRRPVQCSVSNRDPSNWDSNSLLYIALTLKESCVPSFHRTYVHVVRRLHLPVTAMWRPVLLISLIRTSECQVHIWEDKVSVISIFRCLKSCSESLYRNYSLFSWRWWQHFPSVQHLSYRCIIQIKCATPN